MFTSESDKDFSIKNSKHNVKAFEFNIFMELE